jgi:hypothetical protein
MSTSLFHLAGWYVTNTEGIPTIYLSITDEALITTSDTPANTRYLPRIRNPEQISFKRYPSFWPWYDSGRQSGTDSPSTIDFEDVGMFTQIEIEDYDGYFDFLTQSDLRDATVVMLLPPAKMLAAANTISTAPIVATCVLDDVTCEEDDVKTIVLKDTLARLDRPLLCRFNPPYADSNAANKMVPITLGACRNVAPQLVDEENRLYRVHDAMLGNIAACRDGGAILDVNANPPEVTPAFDRSGVQTEVLPAYKFLVDCSSVGQQVIPAGATDVLGGVGTLNVSGGLTTWPVAGSPPTGWTYGNPTAGTYTRLAAANGYDQDYVMQMVTHHVYNPSIAEFGLYANITTALLQPGSHYRVRFIIDRLYRPGGTQDGGFLIRTDLTRAATGDVSGSGFGPYLQAASGGQNYVFDYECPNDGTARTLYMIMVGAGASFADQTGTWHGLTVELLGQFNELPLAGIKYQDYFYEVLFNRAYESTSVWNASDLIALDNATGYTFGMHFEDPPNILRDMLMPPLKSACATPFSDKIGALRARRLIDPKLGTPVASFDLTDTNRPISIMTDKAEFLTTLAGGPRNWAISQNPADFVTDRVSVPIDLMARYSRTSQYELTSSVFPAGQYSHAIGAPIFDMVLEYDPNNPSDQGNIQKEIDRVISLYAPTIYSDGTIFNGKRRFVEFTVHFDDITAVGTTTTTAAADLLIGDIVTLTYAEHGFNNTPIFVAGTDLFPFAQMLTIRGWL